MEKQIQNIKDWLGEGSVNIFGRPFTGKDTQGKKLAELLGGVLLGGGDILRGSEIPEHVKELMHAGKLVPTEDYLEIVLPYLKKNDFRGKPLILSSVGRWHGEEAGFLEAMAASNHSLRAVVHLKMEEAEVWQRWEVAPPRESHGLRADDTLESLQIRLQEYREKTLPVVDFYRNQGLLIEVDGTTPRDEVTAAIIAGLDEFSRR
ncbi:MAG TPA: nucleoside monophosphate kinase [Candidatus Saccharimonadales bacterium]|nr:nucleoside monophosphate kinase [Candidatus Saccharimonadales bacterium]